VWLSVACGNRSSVIWEVKKKRDKWITLNNETILILEEAYKKDPHSVIEKEKIKVKAYQEQIQSTLPNELIKMINPKIIFINISRFTVKGKFDLVTQILCYKAPILFIYSYF